MREKRPPLQAALMKAVRQSDKKAILKAIAEGADPAFRRGEAARQLAAQGDDWLFDLVAEQSGPTHTWDAVSQRLLVELAAKGNNFAMARLALDAPATPDLSDPGFYGVPAALKERHYAMAEWLWALLPRPIPFHQVMDLLRVAIRMGHLGWFKRGWAHFCEEDRREPWGACSLLRDAITAAQLPVVAFLLVKGRVTPEFEHLQAALAGNQRRLVLWLKDRVDWTARADELWAVSDQHTVDLDLQGLFLPTCPWRRDFLGYAIRHGHIDQAELLWEHGYRSTQLVTPTFLSAIIQRRDPHRLAQMMACAAGLDTTDRSEWMMALIEVFSKGRPMRQAMVRHMDMTPVIEMLAYWAADASPGRRNIWLFRLRWLLPFLDFERENGRVLQAVAHFGLDWAIAQVLPRSPIELAYQALIQGKISPELKESWPCWPTIDGPAWTGADTLGCHVDEATRQRWLLPHANHLPKMLAQVRLAELTRRLSPATVARRWRA